MRVLFVHNDYSLPSGEEHAVEALASLLKEHGHIVEWYRRSSAELNGSYLKTAFSFFTGIRNPAAIKSVKRILDRFQPDIVQVQNLYPLISPAVLKTIRSASVPVVMRCPNYRLFCPTGLFFDPSGNVCEKCTGSGHEWWCIRKNCMGSRSKSTGYALRNFVARKTDVFRKNVDIFIVQSEFQKKKFIDLGIDALKIAVLPGVAPSSDVIPVKKGKKYVSFVGRVSFEKGVDDFISAALQLPDLQFVIAGDVPENSKYIQAKNLEWKGFVTGEELEDLFVQSYAIIVPSRCYEGFPNVITRAMNYGVPVISTNIGCFPEIIEHGVNGLLYPAGDIDALVSEIQRIISDPAEAVKMGARGREKAAGEYSRESIYKRMMEIYKLAANKHL